MTYLFYNYKFVTFDHLDTFFFNKWMVRKQEGEGLLGTNKWNAWTLFEFWFKETKYIIERC